MVLILHEILIQDNVQKVKSQSPEVFEIFAPFAHSAVRRQKVGMKSHYSW